MTTPFYAPPSAIRGNQVVLPEGEARHATRVLRKAPGDEVVVVDGAGGWHRMRLDRLGKRRATGTILATEREVGEPPYRLTVGLALLKNRNRFETFLEKAVELGVSTVVPLRTTRTEKKGRLKKRRAQRILVAAMKQCGRSRLPRLAPPQPLADVLGQDTSRLTLMAHEAAGPEASITRALAEAPAADRLLVLVGPEGGFTGEEVEAARAAGGRVVGLGPRRLRAETAALAAASAVMLHAGAAL